MADKLEISDLIPRLPGNSKLTVSASASIDGFLKIKVKNIPEAQILNSIKNAIDRASSRITVDLKAALDEAMMSDVWATTKGRGDIYETGELMDSGRVTMSSNGIKIVYTAPYASLVHYGGYIHPYGNKSLSVYLPPRPWVESVLNGLGPIRKFDFAKYYREEIENTFK